MSFELDTSNDFSGESTGPKVDWDALNQYIVDTLDCEDGETVMGTIMGYYDLGTQPMDNFETFYDPEDERQKEALDNAEETGAFVETKNFFDDGKWHNDVEVFSRPQAPVKAFTYVIEFPEYMVNKGQYFGDENAEEKPYRLTLGSTWSYVDPDGDGKKKMQAHVPAFRMKESNQNGKWGYSTNSTIHKMAKAAGLLNEDGLFKKEDRTKLMGQSFQFNLEVKINEYKGKKFISEKVKFASKLPKSVKAPEVDSSTLFGINMNKANDPETVYNLNQTTINTFRRATDYKGSVLETEINEMKAKKKAEWEANKAKAEEAPSKAPSSDEGTDDFDDDELPF